MDGSKTVKHDRKARGRRANARPTKADIQYQQILALLEELQAGPRYLRRLMVGMNGRLLLIETASIDWIEAQGNYVRVHTGKTEHVLRRRIGQLESLLNPQVFLRANRSAIVNIDRVRELQPLSHGDLRLVLDVGTELALSRNYRRNFARLLGEEE